MHDNVLPKIWRDHSYPTNKNLASWIIDLTGRLKYLEGWKTNGIPSAFWVSGFFFTQSFFTGIRQNFSRKVTY